MSGKRRYFMCAMVVWLAGCSGLGKEDQCRGVIPEGYACCGNQVIPNFLCCNTVKLAANQICCAGSRTANLETEICCAGEVYPRETVECCDRTPSPRGTCSAPKRQGI